MRDNRGRSSLGIDIQAACLPRPLTEADIPSAHRHLTALAERVRQAYMSFGLTELQRTRVEVDTRPRDKDRHFAACRTDGRLILLAPHLILLPPQTVTAIVGHEFGHAADYAYPAQFRVVPRGDGYAVDRYQVGTRSNQGVPPAVYRAWLQRSDDQIEQAADAIAEVVLGTRIGYCGPCRLQTILDGSEPAGCVRPRPRGLR